jgi:di/tripeptidase
MTIKKILTYAACGLLVTGSSLGAYAYEGDSTAAYEQDVYESPNTNSMVREFETEVERTRAATDPNEIERRQYIPQFMQGSSGTVTGTVTLVGDDEMRMVESGTGIEHQIRITEAQQKQLTTGFNITAELDNGRLVSFIEEGVPPDVEKIVYSAEDLPQDNILDQQRAF